MDWTRTRSVLADLGKLLTCAICESYLKDPCTLDNCDHNFCRKCIEESLGSDSKCPECGSFSWLKDLRLNHQLQTTVTMTLKLQSLIGLNMEVEDVSPPDHSSESSENTFTFGSDEEMRDEVEDEQYSEYVSTTKPDTTPSRVEEYVHSETKHSLVESGSGLANHARTAETATESTNVKQNTNARKSATVRRHDKTKPSETVLSNATESESETHDASTEKTTQPSEDKTQPSETVLSSTTESKSEVDDARTAKPTIESTIVKQDVRKSVAFSEHNSKARKQRSSTNITKSTKNDIDIVNINEAINTTENTNLHKPVNRRNNKTKKSNVQMCGTRQRPSGESEPITVLETTTLVQAIENTSNVKDPSNTNESEHTSMKKSRDTTEIAETTTVENTNGKNHEIPSTRRKRSKSCADNNQGVVQSNKSNTDKTVGKKTGPKVSEQNVPRKKYSFRNKLNKKDSNMAGPGEPFDFTQQQDPFHFTDGESDDDHDNDNDDHNTHDNDDHDTYDHDNDEHDNNDYDNDDHDNDDNDNDDSSRNRSSLRSKSTNNTLPQGRKTRRDKSSLGHFEYTNEILQSRNSAKTRLRNQGNVTAEQTKKTQFTLLKDRPRNCTQNDKSGIEEKNKKNSSKGLTKSKGRDVGGEENVTLNVKRRRVRPKRNNIRQYLISVDSASDDNSSDGVPPVPQKRKKLRNPLTSSSQNSRNAGASSQSSRNKRGETPLHLAAIKGDLAFARELIKEGEDPNEKDHAGWTPLHEACNHGHVGIVELFLDHDALLNIPGFDNDTPLHDAVANDRLKVVQLLVARGAVLTARNKQGLLPMDYAVTKQMKAALSSRTVSSSSKPAEDIEIVKKCADSCRESLVVLGTALKTQDQVTLKKCIKLLAGTVVDELDESVTHVVTSVNKNGHCPRTMKYLSGILTGKWIVSFEWIKDCLRQRQWLDEDIYEVEGSAGKTCNAARKARFNFLQQMPRLLDGCSFFLRGVFKPPTPSKQDIIKLIILGGGKVLHREPKIKDDDLTSLPSSPIVTSLSRAPEVAYHAAANSTLSCCTEFIIYDSASCDQTKIIHSPVLQTAPVTWLMDCISSFQLLDIPDV